MKISILTTSYNYEQFIAQTIESVLNQSYKDFEYIIIDDGSSDNSLNIINEFALKDSRIKVFTHPNNQNKGLIYTIKKGIEYCSGEYIIFVESDDILEPNYIERKLQISNKFPDADIIYNDLKLIGDEERIKDFNKYLKVQKDLINKSSFNISELTYINIIPTFSCVMLKKEILDNIKYEFSVPACFDWCLWNSLLYKSKIIYCADKLTVFRLHKQSYTCQKNELNIRYELIKKLFGEKINIFDKIYLSTIKNKKIEKFFRGLLRTTNKFYIKLKTADKKIKIIKV